MNRFAVFDLDGTLSDPTHRLHLHQKGMSDDEWNIFYKESSKDKPIESTINILGILRNAGYGICIVSGRSKLVLEETRLWLSRNAVTYDELYMRENGDKRADTLIKREWYENIGRYLQIDYVFEDRERVCRMWRSLGLQTYQVAEGNF